MVCLLEPNNELDMIFANSGKSGTQGMLELIYPEFIVQVVLNSL